MKSTEAVGLGVGILAFLKGIYEGFKLLKRMWKSRAERNEAISDVVKSYKENTARLISIEESQTKQTNMLQEVLKKQALQGQTQKIIINMQGVYWLSNEKGETVECSKSAMDLTGRSFDELKGYNWFNWVEDNDKARVQNDMTQAMQRQSDFRTHYTMTKPDKSKVDIIAYAEIVKDNDRVLGWVGILQAA